ncbi:MAG: sugar transferase [Pseudomonadota bacterium]
MTTPLHRDGATHEDTPPQYGADTAIEASKGFSEASMGFQLDDTTVLPASLDKARRQVEDLLKDAGVAPPRPGHRLHHTVEAEIAPARVDHVRPTPRLMPIGAHHRSLKRGIDLVGSILAIAFFAPLMALITLALLLEGGPVLYRQTRIGRARQRFNCIKFRTMRRDAEDRLNLLLACNDDARAEWRKHQKLTDDPRVTPVGRLLRESSLDELPQLLNVLRGEMSLVGPRPIIAPEIPGYDADRAYFGSAAFEDYAACLPGITGLWQISGRHKTIYLDRVRLDRQYVRTWSIWLDVKIVWRTIGVVLCRSGR